MTIKKYTRYLAILLVSLILPYALVSHWAGSRIQSYMEQWINVANSYGTVKIERVAYNHSLSGAFAKTQVTPAYITALQDENSQIVLTHNIHYGPFIKTKFDGFHVAAARIITTVILPEEVQAVIDKAIGTDKLIDIETLVNFDGSSTSWLDIAKRDIPFYRQEAENEELVATLHWNGLHIVADANIDPVNEVSTGSGQGFQLEGERFTLTMSPYEINTSSKQLNDRHLITEEKLTIQTIQAADPAQKDRSLANLSNIQVLGYSELQDGLFSSEGILKIDSIAFASPSGADSAITNIVYDSALKNFDMQSFQNIMTKVNAKAVEVSQAQKQKVSHKRNQEPPLPPSPLDIVSVVTLEDLRDLLEHSPTLSLRKFHIETQMGNIDLRGKIGYVHNEQHEVSHPMELIQGIDGWFTLLVGKPLLDMAFAFAPPMGQAGPFSDSNMQTNRNPLLATLLDNRVITEMDDLYELQIVVDKGVPYINGLPAGDVLGKIAPLFPVNPLMLQPQQTY